MDFGATISIFVALVGCFVGLAGWLAGRDKKNGESWEWRGSISTKIDNILCNQVELKKDIYDINLTLGIHSTSIAIVEEVAKSAHKRIDKIEGVGGINEH